VLFYFQAASLSTSTTALPSQNFSPRYTRSINSGARNFLNVFSAICVSFQIMASTFAIFLNRFEAFVRRRIRGTATIRAKGPLGLWLVPLANFDPKWMVLNGDSTIFVVRRCIQCSLGEES
jgi:hypothetical protein